MKINRTKIYRRRVLAVCLLFASVSLIVIAGINIISWYIDGRVSQGIQSELELVANVTGFDDTGATLVNPPDDPDNDYWNFIKTPLISVDFGELQARNPDTVAWIKINSTNINYPVVRTTNNDFYLTHAFDRSYNRAGWVFADYRNNYEEFDENTIIYGHSRVDSTIFGSLKNALKKDWHSNKDNHIILLATPDQSTMWQVFSVYKTPPDSSYLVTEFLDDAQLSDFIDTVKSRSIHQFNTTVGSSDNLLTISTCANNAANERIVLHARLIKSQPR